MSSSGTRLSWIPLKVLLYEDLVGIVTSRHVTKMTIDTFGFAVAEKNCCTQKIHHSVFYTSDVIAR